MKSIDNEVDEFGNLWVSDLPIRFEMSSSDFYNRFAKYSTIAIAIKPNDDRIYAAGNCEENLEKGFLSRGLKPEEFKLEPGPLNNIYFTKNFNN